MVDIADMKSQNQAIQKSNTDIEKTITFISKQYDDVLKQMKGLQKEKQEATQYILSLETKILDLQRTSRPSSVEIRNVPTKDKESPLDLSDIVTKMGSTIDVKIDNAQIRDVYRLPGKPQTVRPIVVEFTNVHIKNQLLTAVRSYNKKHLNKDRLNTQCIGLSNERQPVYVSEHLPPSSRKLMYAAREYAKHNHFDFCWSSNGNILIKKTASDKPIMVKSEQCLRDLQVKTNI